LTTPGSGVTSTSTKHGVGLRLRRPLNRYWKLGLYAFSPNSPSNWKTV